MDSNSNLQMVNNLRFLAKWSRDISRELSTQSVTLKNVKNGEFFMCAKFWFSTIIYAEFIANNSFSTGKPLSLVPGLTLLEVGTDKA